MNPGRSEYDPGKPGARAAPSAAAEVQRRLWGTDPRAWADLAEAHNRPLFEAVLDAAGVGRGTRVLDVGCGSGLVPEAMSALIPPERAGDHAPYALSVPGNLEAALAGAGLRLIGNSEAAGEYTVRGVLRRTLAQFLEPQTGVVTLRNTFRLVASRR